jgi:hypothetical protein
MLRLHIIHREHHKYALIIGLNHLKNSNLTNNDKITNGYHYQEHLIKIIILFEILNILHIEYCYQSLIAPQTNDEQVFLTYLLMLTS